MSLRNSIGTRIFGLAVFLLALTITLICFLLLHGDRLRSELVELTQLDIPLANSLSRLDEYGLRRRLAFERTFGALNLDAPDAKVLAEAQAEYEEFSARKAAEFERAKALLEQEDLEPEDLAEASEIAGLLHQMEAGYPAITAQENKALELQRSGDHASANLVADGLSDLQGLVQSQRAQLQNGSARRAERIAQHVLEHQWGIFLLTIAATISTVALGLVVALLVTRAIVRPVHSLIGAIDDIQKGRLDLELPVRSNDELGLLTTAFNFFVKELRAKEQMRETFGRYVDPRILKTLLDVDIASDASGGREVMTVSFGDLVGFTLISERLTPANMVRLLNRHFGLQAEAVQAQQGIVDKFIGDSIMAFWGPPFVSPTEHPAKACRAALAQLAAIETLRAELPELTGLRRDTPEIDLRLGIASGEVIVGNIGSTNTRSFTVIGDTVNLAARLESANRFYGTRILVTDVVARDAGPEFELREIDSIAVKGKVETAKIFELLGVSGCLDEATARARDSYADGLRTYRSGDWDAAESAFTACLALRPDDGASRVMLDRIARFRQTPPDEWDGVWRLDAK